MGLRYPNQTCHDCFFATTSFFDRQRYGELAGVYQILEENMIFYSKKYKVKIAGYVLMPSHLHLLLFISGKKLSEFMRDFKKYTAILALTNCTINRHNIWMPRYDRQVVNSERLFRIKLNYIHNNPVKAKLAGSPEDWQWSSAAAYLTDRETGVPVWKNWA